jgi:hypothetical protein
MKWDVITLIFIPHVSLVSSLTFSIPPYNPPFELPSGPFTGQWPAGENGRPGLGWHGQAGFWRLCVLNQSRQVWVLPLGRRFSGLPPSFTTPIC